MGYNLSIVRLLTSNTKACTDLQCYILSWGHWDRDFVL